MEGLVIDDYFAVSIDDKSCPDTSTQSYGAYATAQKAYEDKRLLGSSEKDLQAAREGKAIGAYINGSCRATDRGVCPVSAPPDKKLALAMLTLNLCALPYTTVSLHRCIVGAWVSVLLFRRPMMSLLNEAFQLASTYEDFEDSCIIPLPRKVAEELVLVSVLVPLILSDIAVPFSETLFATDASDTRGAVVSTEVGCEVVQLLSRCFKTKGSYTRLQSSWTCLLQRVGLYEELPEEHPAANVERPLAYSFSFIEIFAGSSRVTAALSRLGVVCGPPIDLSKSEEYDVSQVRVISWLFHLIERGSLRGFMLEPPCTTFSIMRRPALRSAEAPFGFDPRDPQTRDGNVLAHRSLQLLKKAAVHRVSGVLERPFTAKTKHLPAYKAILSLPQASEVRADSCQFGSVHQKSFALLGINIDLRQLQRRCRCQTKHVPVEGARTKASAIYTPELAFALAWSFRHAIQHVESSDPLKENLPVHGLESQIVNEIAQSSHWEVQNSWAFKRKQHINLLELKSVEKLVEKVSKQSPQRIFCLVDSNVSRGALGKGRSASRALTAVLRRIAAMLVAFAVYLTTPFCPTRLNVADDPTRDRFF